MRGLATTAVLVAVVGAACSNGADTSSTVDERIPTSSSITIPDSTEHGIVSGVVDGDTVQIMIGEEPKVVDLAGIRAPQGDECYAAEASLAVADVVAGRSVALVGDGTDAEGTPLRYLIIDEDVPILVNVELVDRGAAVALHGHELAGDFLRVNDAAYASGRGMWGTFVCGQPPQSVAPDRPQLRIETISTPGAGSQDPASVEIVNASYTEVAIGRWTMRDATNASSFTFSEGTVLAPGDTLTVMMSCESDSPAWCVDAAMWSAGGNTVIMADDLGNIVDRRVHEIEVSRDQ